MGYNRGIGCSLKRWGIRCQGNAPDGVRRERELEMDATVIIAISIIALGFVILAGLAIWLALDRQRRSQSTPAVQQPPQSGLKAAHPSPAPAVTPAAAPGPIEAKQTPARQTPSSQKAPASLPDPQHSGEYPAAEQYDQTFLPQPPRRRTRKSE